MCFNSKDQLQGGVMCLLNKVKFLSEVKSFDYQREKHSKCPKRGRLREKKNLEKKKKIKENNNKDIGAARYQPLTRPQQAAEAIYPSNDNI